MDSPTWTTLATFAWLSEAETLKSALEGSGIESFIPEQHIGAINPMTIGVQVRVQIHPADLESAQAILREHAGLPEPEKCPSCNSANLRVKPLGLKGWLQFVICALTMVPMRGPSQKYCAACRKPIEAEYPPIN